MFDRGGLDLAGAEKTYAELFERCPRRVGHAWKQASQGTVEHVDTCPSCSAESVAAVSVPIKPAPTTRDREWEEERGVAVGEADEC